MQTSFQFHFVVLLHVHVAFLHCTSALEKSGHTSDVTTYSPMQIPKDNPSDIHWNGNQSTSLQTTGKNHFKFSNSLNCSSLCPGQYRCNDPVIDPESQRAVNCSKKTRTVKVPCFPVEGIYCNHILHSGTTFGFYKDVPCRWTNGKKLSVAVLLSVFLGWLGIDRFYLGYPAIGLVKLCTFGFMFLGHLIDVLLIAIQVVGPADGSDYVVDYYGAGLSRLRSNNETYILPPDYS